MSPSLWAQNKAICFSTGSFEPTCDGPGHLWQSRNSVRLIHAKSYNTTEFVGYSTLQNTGVFSTQFTTNNKAPLSNLLIEFFPAFFVLEKVFSQFLSEY